MLEITQLVLSVWKSRNITPLFHLSEYRPWVTVDDSITARRAHSEYIQ
jgi:hypothetical protein